MDLTRKRDEMNVWVVVCIALGFLFIGVLSYTAGIYDGRDRKMKGTYSYSWFCPKKQCHFTCHSNTYDSVSAMAERHWHREHPFELDGWND